MKHSITLLMFWRRNHCHICISWIVTQYFAFSTLTISIKHKKRYSCAHNWFKNFCLETIGRNHNRLNLLANYSCADLKGRMHEVDQWYIMIFLLCWSFVIDDWVQVNLTGILRCFGFVMQRSEALTLEFRLLWHLLCSILETTSHTLEV